MRHRAVPSTYSPSSCGVRGSRAREPHVYARLKKRIVRTLIEEIVVDADGRAGEIIAVVHWKGGVHTEVCIRAGDAATAELTRRRRLWTVCECICSDDTIAGALSRSGLVTGMGNRST